MIALRSVRRSSLTAGIAVASLLAAAGALRASGITSGPPWISIETPVNPYDGSTRGAFLLVHAFHHGVPVAYPVTGTAEGLVNGERRTTTLAFTPTSQPATFALKKMWSDSGIWTLVIKVHQGADDVAQALVEIGADGEVSRVRVPTRAGERNMRFPSQLSPREIDDALAVRAKLQRALTH